MHPDGPLWNKCFLKNGPCEIDCVAYSPDGVEQGCSCQILHALVSLAHSASTLSTIAQKALSWGKSAQVDRQRTNQTTPAKVK